MCEHLCRNQQLANTNVGHNRQVLFFRPSHGCGCGIVHACKSTSRVEARLWRAALCERTQEQRALGAGSMPALPAPPGVASMSVVHSHEKDSDQTPVTPLQAPKNALFASRAAMAVAAWRRRVVDKHARSLRVQLEAGNLLKGRN